MAEDIVWIREEPSNQNVFDEIRSEGIFEESVAPGITEETSVDSITGIRQEQNVISDNKFGRIEETGGFDISECERRLNEVTRETKELVNQLCDKSNKLKENSERIAGELAVEKALLTNCHQAINDFSQFPPPPELPSGGLPKNIESMLIGMETVKLVTGALILPTGIILVTDDTQGLLLFDIEGNLIKKANHENWRKPRSPTYYKEHVLVLVDMKDSEGGWSRFIFKFTLQLDFVARIEGPRWLKDHTVLGERMSIAHTDCLYLSICGEIFSALYELTPVGQWTELEYRLSESYVDMLAFATIGPITQLLIVEGRKNYVLQLSVQESRIVRRRRLAICERPGALARDEAGRLFVANRSSASIQLVDTINWSSTKNVALADALVPCFSACWGLLAIPVKGAVRLVRYSFRG